MRTGLSHNDMHKCLSTAAYIREFRTIGLVFPRRSGKTTYLRQLREHESCLYITMNTLNADDVSSHRYDYSVITFDGIDKHFDRFRGMPRFGMKYSSFLVDEFTRMTPKHKEDLNRLIGDFSAMNMLTDDFYVMMLGT